jgi:4-oxalocrotonate tautomerase
MPVARAPPRAAEPDFVLRDATAQHACCGIEEETEQKRSWAMPYVNVRITKDGVTAEQKAEIVADITRTLQRVLGKRPEHTHVVIDEVDPKNWGFAGMLTTEYRKQGR